MSWLKPVYAAAIALGAVIGGAFGYLAYQAKIEKHYTKPNVLILSLCSLRKAELDYFNRSKTGITPNIDRVFKNGIALDNVYSSFGWTNLALYFLRELDEKFFIQNGYDVIKDDWRPATVSVPGPIDLHGKNTPPEQAWHQISQLNFVNGRVALYRRRPFFGFIHIKYMHYPYIDSINENSGWDKFLSPQEKSRVEKILNDSQLPEEQIPLALALSGKSKMLDAHPELKGLDPDPYKVFNGLYNVLTDKLVLGKWAASAEFNPDLEILKKVYRAKLNKLDETLAQLMNLYGRKDLIDNTIVVLMGDHGEAMMEHGILGHSVHVYDEILTPPVLVRFPRTWRPKIEYLSEQIYMGSLVDWMKEMIKGNNKEDFFKKSIVENPRNKYIVSRNCSNNIHSVRFDNKWKLIIDRVNREKMLFNLKTDPGETKNVYDSQPQIAADLEIYLAGNMKDLDAIVDPTPCRDF